MSSKNQRLKKLLALAMMSSFTVSSAVVPSVGVSAWSLFSRHSKEEIADLKLSSEKKLQECLDLVKDLDGIDDYTEKLANDKIANYQSQIEEIGTTSYDKQNEVSKDVDNLVEILKLAKTLDEFSANTAKIKEADRRKYATEEWDSLAKLIRKAIENNVTNLNGLEKRIVDLRDYTNSQLKIEKRNAEHEAEAAAESLKSKKIQLEERLNSVYKKASKVLDNEQVESLKNSYNSINAAISAMESLTREEGISDLISDLNETIEAVLAKEAKKYAALLAKNIEKKNEEYTGKIEEITSFLSEIKETINDRTVLDAVAKLENAISKFQKVLGAVKTQEDLNELDEAWTEMEEVIANVSSKKNEYEANQAAIAERENSINDLRDTDKKLAALTNGKLDLNDVCGGNEKAKTKLRNLIKSYEKFNKGGKIAPSKGLLLYGEPGTGKTSLVVAVAAKEGAELFLITPSLVMGSEGEKKALEVIQTAKKTAQITGKFVILLIDEIDAIAQKRSGSDTNKVLVMLMNELDKLKPSDNVIVVATTNRKEALDPAIIRSKRLDQSVEVGLPNAEDKLKILNIYLKNIKINGKVNLVASVDRMKKFTGADIEKCVDIALDTAMDRIGTENLAEIEITIADLDAGIAAIIDAKDM